MRRLTTPIFVYLLQQYELPSLSPSSILTTSQSPSNITIDIMALDSLDVDGRISPLNDTDNLRSFGVSQVINLPQIIVCGDQSSGKSSLLEAISGILFPRKDNL